MRYDDETKQFLKASFLEALAKNPRDLGLAAETAGFSRTALFHWLAADEEFAEAVREVREKSTDQIEQSYFELATNKKTPALARARALEFFLRSDRPAQFNRKPLGDDDNASKQIVINFVMGTAGATQEGEKVITQVTLPGLPESVETGDSDESEDFG